MQGSPQTRSSHHRDRGSSNRISLDDSLQHHPMLIPSRKSSKLQTNEETIFDVIIIGAGISGLLAAEILLREQKTVLVLEMSSECGGSIKQHSIEELIEEEARKPWMRENAQVRQTKVEVGTSELMSDHSYMIRLCEEYDLSVSPMYSDGKFIYGQSEGQFEVVESMMDVYFSPEHKRAISKVLAKIENISRNILEVHQKIINNPGKNHYLGVLREYIQKFDRMTVREFFTRELQNESLRSMVINEFEIVESIQVDKVSMFHVFLHGYGLENLKYFTLMKSYLTQTIRIKEGNMELIRRLRAKVLKRQKKNSQEVVLKFNEKVLEIKNEINKEVEVITNKRSYKCFKVFFSATMESAKEVKISKLSDTKRFLLNNQEEGSLQRAFLIFETAFWRSKFSGSAVFSEQFPVSEMVDMSPPNLSCGILCMVICGSKTLKWKQKFKEFSQQPGELKKAQQKYLSSLIAKMFLNGDQKHPNLESMLAYIADSDNYCYQSFTKIGIANELQNSKEDYLQCYIRDEHNIIFLGSELSKKFGSYMEGAVRHTREQIYRYLQMQDPWNHEVEALQKRIN